MTTIAYRSGVIAADTGFSGDGLQDCYGDKIAKRADGAVAGAAGCAWWIAAFLECFAKGGSLIDLPASNVSTGIVVSRRGITIYESDKDKVRSFGIRAKYYAIGSGNRIAMGAMFAGAHPVDAVRAAIAHDDSTYGPIQELRVGK